MAKAFKILPDNYLKDWGEFESWSLGAGSAPDGWLRATNPTVAQETTNIKFGLNSASVTGSSGSEGGIYRTIPNGSDLAGRTFTLSVWGKSASTGPFIRVSDGVSSATTHLDGLNAFAEFTTPSLKLDVNATEIRVDLYASAGDLAYFDSAILCEGEDLFTNLDDNIAISNWEPSLNIRNDEFEVSQREGAFIPDVRLSGRPIRMRGTVVGTDVLSCRSHFDILMKSLLAWQTNEKRNIYLYDDRVAEVFLRNFNWSYVNGLQMVNFDLQLSMPDATLRYINKFRHREVISGSITEFNLSYGGNALSRPIISFVADQGSAITTCTLQNLTIDESFSYVGTVPTNVALDINCDQGTVLNSSVNKIADFSGDFFGIVRGTNYLRFSGSDCTIHIDYFERFL